MAQAPYGEQAPHAIASRLKIGSKVNLLLQTVDRYVPHRGPEIDREVNLNLAMVEDGSGLCVRKFPGPCDAEGLSEPKFRATGRRYGCEGAWGGITKALDFDAVEDQSGSAA